MRRFGCLLRGSGFSAFLGVRVSLLLVVQVVGAPSLCAGEGVWGACQLANFSTCRVVGLLAGSGDGGRGGSVASECWCVLAGGLVSVPGCLFLYIWRVGCF